MSDHTYRCDKIFVARPRSSVDRVSASGAEERSSSLRGGAFSPLQGGVFVAVESICELEAHFIYPHSIDDQWLHNNPNPNPDSFGDAIYHHRNHTAGAFFTPNGNSASAAYAHYNSC